jgi:GGDEF domain-containing protein
MARVQRRGSNTSRRKNPQEIIAEVGATIASSVVLEDVLKAVVRQIGEALGADTCDIHDYDAESDLLTFVANWALHEDPGIADYLGTSFPPAERGSFLPLVRERRTIELHVDDPDLPADERREMERWTDLTTLDTPLVYGDEVIGVLGLTDRHVRHYARDERWLFAQLAVLAAITIHNARMFRRQEEQNRHLASLLDASRALTSTVVLEEVLSLVARKTAEALGATRCSILEQDAQDAGLRLRCTYPPQPAASDQEPAADLETIAVSASPAAGSVLVERVDDPELDAARRAALTSRGEGARLVVPLAYGDERLGLLAVTRSSQGRSFGAAEIELAQGLSEQAAAAIQNARLYQTLQQQAVTDALTGLYNFRYFQERLQEEVSRALRYGLPLSLIMLDIDGFKDFNDSHGHLMGDDALRSIGKLLRGRLRQHVDIPARYGGEEFVVILPSTAIDTTWSPGRAPGEGGGAPAIGAAMVAERLRHDIEDESVTAGPVALPEPVTVSLGVAELLRHGRDATELIAAADRALYAAKRAGKNRVGIAERPRT